MARTPTALMMAAMVLLSACAGADGSEASSIRSWQAPDAYRFTVESSCGERSFIGKFRVLVENGSIAEVEGLDEAGRALIGHGVEKVPTLSELLDEADSAEEEGADVVEVEATDDGRPTDIKIDWETDATDDEACYAITGYSAAN